MASFSWWRRDQNEETPLLVGSARKGVAIVDDEQLVDVADLTGQRVDDDNDDAPSKSDDHASPSPIFVNEKRRRHAQRRRQLAQLTVVAFLAVVALVGVLRSIRSWNAESAAGSDEVSPFIERLSFSDIPLLGRSHHSRSKHQEKKEKIKHHGSSHGHGQKKSNSHSSHKEVEKTDGHRGKDEHKKIKSSDSHGKAEHDEKKSDPHSSHQKKNEHSKVQTHSKEKHPQKDSSHRGSSKQSSHGDTSSKSDDDTGKTGAACASSDWQCWKDKYAATFDAGTPGSGEETSKNPKTNISDKETYDKKDGNVKVDDGKKKKDDDNDNTTAKNDKEKQKKKSGTNADDSTSAKKSSASNGNKTTDTSNAQVGSKPSCASADWKCWVNQYKTQGTKSGDDDDDDDDTDGDSSATKKSPKADGKRQKSSGKDGSDDKKDDKVEKGKKTSNGVDVVKKKKKSSSDDNISDEESTKSSGNETASSDAAKPACAADDWKCWVNLYKNPSTKSGDDKGTDGDPSTKSKKANGGGSSDAIDNSEMKKDKDGDDDDDDDGNDSGKKKKGKGTGKKSEKALKPSDGLKYCMDGDYTKRTLKLAYELPFAALFRDTKGRHKFEASSVTVVDDVAYAIGDSSWSISVFDPFLEAFGEYNQLLGDPEREVEDSGYEAIFFDNSTFYVVRESIEDENVTYHAVIEELDLDVEMDSADSVYKQGHACPTEFKFEGDSKGFEGAVPVHDLDGNLIVLGLCEGNYCSQSNKLKLDKGNGRLVAMKETALPDGTCLWKTIRIIEIPPSAGFGDYSSIAMDSNGRVAISSQEESQLWVGYLGGLTDDERWDIDAMELDPENYTVYDFPKNDDCETVYCNIEGITWLNKETILAVSDKMKSKGRQPFRCSEKDQSSHVFVLP